MREFTQEGMFNELSKVTRELNRKKFEKMDLPRFTDENFFTIDVNFFPFEEEETPNYKKLK